MKKKINSPVVWITGASKGIGKEIAISFAQIGCQVIISSKNKKLLAETEKYISKLNGKVKAIPCDVSSEKSVKFCSAKINKLFGHVCILVNNAAITEFLPFDKTSLKQFDAIINTNLKSIFLCTNSVLNQMKKKKSGTIINILSVAAIKTFTNSSVYSASKAGASALTKSLREEVRKFGIRVINILPGMVNTKMWSLKDRKLFSSRMLNPKDVAEIVLSAYCQPNSVMIEEIIVRPQSGDI